MTLYVAKGQVPSAAGKITVLTDALRGYVLQSYVMSGVDGQKPSATITVRVPAQNFQEAIRRIGQLGEVKALQTGAEDVTGQYVDLKARLTHYRAVERRLLTFLANATSINQALAIQQRIDNTQLTVEELAGQVKAMREQITYGTLSVSITEKPGKTVAPATKHQTFLAAFVHSVTLLGSAARALFVALGAAIPFLALIAGARLAGLDGGQATGPPAAPSRLAKHRGPPLTAGSLPRRDSWRRAAAPEGAAARRSFPESLPSPTRRTCHRQRAALSPGSRRRASAAACPTAAPRQRA